MTSHLLTGVRPYGEDPTDILITDGAIAAMGASAYINEQLHLRTTLLEPESVTAFFYSSIDEKQVKLLKAVEDAAKAKGVKIPLIDGYRNARMTEKLELSAKMPALVELRKGAVAKVTTVASEADVQKVLA